MSVSDNSRSGPVLLVGGGKMGGAMLAGWLSHGVTPADILVVEPDGKAAASLRDQYKVGVGDSLPEKLERAPSMVIFAVKPQVLANVAPPYKRLVGADTAFLSIAAGKTIAFFQRHLGANAAIIRAMPNTPAAVGRGITVLTRSLYIRSGGKSVTAKSMNITQPSSKASRRRHAPCFVIRYP